MYDIIFGSGHHAPTPRREKVNGVDIDLTTRGGDALADIAPDWAAVAQVWNRASQVQIFHGNGQNSDMRWKLDRTIIVEAHTLPPIWNRETI